MQALVVVQYSVRDSLVWLLGRLRPLLASVCCMGHVVPGIGNIQVKIKAGVGDQFAFRTVHMQWGQPTWNMCG